ncbi:MAG: 4Fe-4S dicluster domain-containing protein [SAR202 cluster bacterium]|nr:4Fe-4S dicluster domain-containing protein [SAR202 cluster bacterium]
MYGLGLFKGLAVTLKNAVTPGRMFTTHQYPNRRISVFELAKASSTNVISYAAKNPAKAVRSAIGLEWVPDRWPQHPRFRGEEFTWYEQRCTGCASCAKYCPLGIIRIVTDPSGRFVQEGEKYAIEVFDIDIGRCMFCGLCVEACPYDALHMGSGFEEGRYTRSGLVIDVNRLRTQPKRPSNWFRPQLEAKDYNPHSGKEATYVDVGRHEKPSEQKQEVKWAKRL